MKYCVNVTAQAKRDIDEIFSYISIYCVSCGNAVKQVERINNKILKLNIMSERFKKYFKISNNENVLDVRMMPVDSYCVFYVVYPEILEVRILRVIHGKRDIYCEFDNILYGRNV